MTEFDTTGVGAQHDQPDPRGWLVFDYLPPDIQNAEDSTQNADYERYGVRQDAYAISPLTWPRPATDAERALLEHLGYGPLPDDLITWVTYLTDGVRNRRWTQLEGE